MIAFPGKEISEDELVKIIQTVVNTLASKFRFGYFDLDDMKQQGALFALEVLKKNKYDPARPLENYLYVHIRNRMINYKRDNYVRNEPPCKGCIFFDAKCKKSKNQCAEFEDKAECEKLAEWNAKNQTKKSLIRPLDVSMLPDHAIQQDAKIEQRMDFEELEHMIRENLPTDLLNDYMRMRADLQISKSRKEAVRAAIIEIYNQEGLDHGG